MKPFGLNSILLGTFIATALSVKAVKGKNKSLTNSGAVAAWIVGFLSVACGTRGLLLIQFYLVGTYATKYKGEVKQARDAHAAEDSVRGASQVLACSAIAVICSLAHAVLYGEERAIDFIESFSTSSLACGVLAHYACCCGDTLASELGMLSSQEPFLVTAPWRRVPSGTNGGITYVGTFWSALGGALMGMGMVIIDMMTGIETKPMETISFGLICGVVGSLLDSIIGAIMQESYYDADKKIIYSGGKPSSCKHISGKDLLTNVQVNVVSELITTILGALLIGPSIYH